MEMCVARLLSLFRAKRSRRSRRGATAVEFAMIATPFIGLMFALVEIMMIFFLQTTLEAATADTARTIRTGQAQSTTAPISKAQFKTNVCARMFGFADCTNRLFVMVQAFPDAPTTMPAAPWADGTLTPGSADDEPYENSAPGQMVVVRAYYVWPLMTPGMSAAFRNFGNATYGADNRVLVATSAFRNEPFR
jgi:Flp pilus assembly protein TadG